MRAALPSGLKPRDKRGTIRAREPRMPPPKHRPRVYRGHNGKIQNSGRRPISSAGGGRPRGLKSTRALRRCTSGRKGSGAFVVSGRRCCGGRGWRGQCPRRHCGLCRAADPKCSSTDRAQGGTAVIRAGRGQAAACCCSGSAAAAGGSAAQIAAAQRSGARCRAGSGRAAAAAGGVAVETGTGTGSAQGGTAGCAGAADSKCSSADRAQGGTTVIRARRGQAAACYCSGSAAAAARAAGSRLQVRQAFGQGKSGWQKMHSPSVVALAH